FCQRLGDGWCGCAASFGCLGCRGWFGGALGYLGRSWSVGGGDLGPREWLAGLFGNSAHLSFQSLSVGGSFVNPIGEAFDDVQQLLVLLFEVFNLVAEGFDVVVAWVEGRSNKRFSGKVQ